MVIKIFFLAICLMSDFFYLNAMEKVETAGQVFLQELSYTPHSGFGIFRDGVKKSLSIISMYSSTDFQVFFKDAPDVACKIMLKGLATPPIILLEE